MSPQSVLFISSNPEKSSAKINLPTNSASNPDAYTSMQDTSSFVNIDIPVKDLNIVKLKKPAKTTNPRVARVVPMQIESTTEPREQGGPRKLPLRFPADAHRPDVIDSNHSKQQANTPTTVPLSPVQKQTIQYPTSNVSQQICDEEVLFYIKHIKQLQVTTDHQLEITAVTSSYETGVQSTVKINNASVMVKLFDSNFYVLLQKYVKNELTGGQIQYVLAKLSNSIKATLICGIIRNDVLIHCN